MTNRSLRLAALLASAAAAIASTSATTPTPFKVNREALITTLFRSPGKQKAQWKSERKGRAT